MRAEDCAETFTFGHDGKPLLIPGPFDSFETLQGRRIADGDFLELDDLAEELEMTAPEV